MLPFGNRWVNPTLSGCDIGMSFIEIPIALVFGRITLWFGDKLLLFARNIRNPESPKRDYERTIWQTLSLSLAIGLPPWLLASQG